MNDQFNKALTNFKLNIQNCKPNNSGQYSHEDSIIVNLNVALVHLTSGIQQEFDRIQKRLDALEKRQPQQQ